MSWTDYREQLEESLNQLKEARTGIFGSPERFNQKRKAFYQERLTLIDEYMAVKS
jgi:2-hydroxychromene-2-carboxylate isomerase